MIRQRLLRGTPLPLPERSDRPALRFSPTAWAKLLFLREPVTRKSAASASPQPMICS